MAVLTASPRVRLGVYEKALVRDQDWHRYFAQVRESGFTFVDLSVDESPERAARLAWSASTASEVASAARAGGVMIGGICLSVHRRYGLGSADAAVRARAGELLADGIELSHNLGAPVLQIAGYYAYYEPADPAARDRYQAGLAAGCDLAALAGVQLGIENVDGPDINSISRAAEMVAEIGSAHLHLYPDVGNIAEQGLDEAAELAAGAGRMLALHVKDVRRGEPRRVTMGTGVVDWHNAFAELARQRWTGRMMIELWNDDASDSAVRSAAAGHFIRARLAEHGIAVDADNPPAEARRG